MKASYVKPLLPLRDIVIFPSMVVPLFVGREKSIKALQDVMKTDKSIVLVTQKNSETDDPTGKDLYQYGCLSKVLQLLKLPDGTVKVLVEGEKRIKIADAIFNRLGHSLSIPESQMQAATVVCASGIAFWMRLIRATTQAAIQLGFDAEEAQRLAMYTSEGAAQLLIQKGTHPEQEIDKVTTPKGCTIEGLNEMEHKGLSSSLIQGMVASFQKINAIKTNQV